MNRLSIVVLLLSTCFSGACAQAIDAIDLNSTDGIINIGKMMDYEVRDVTVSINNTSNLDFVATRVVASCGCTTIKNQQNFKVQALASTLLKFQLHYRYTGKPTQVSSEIVVEGEGRVCRFKLAGKVQPSISISPQRLQMNSDDLARNGSERLGEIEIAGINSEKIETVTAHCDNTAVHCNIIKDVGVAGKIKVPVDINPGFLSEQRGINDLLRLSVRTKSGTVETSIPVIMTVKPSVVFDPPIINLGVLREGKSGPFEGSIKVTSPIQGDHFELVNVGCANKNVLVSAARMSADTFTLNYQINHVDTIDGIAKIPIECETNSTPNKHATVNIIAVELNKTECCAK